jgi:hypothetical protein
MTARHYILVLSAALVVAAGSAADPDSAAQPPHRFDVNGGHYLVLPPGDYQPGDRPPLIIALHGTDTTAADMVRAWSELELPVPSLLAAPQNASAGWLDGEAGLIEATLSDLHRRFTYDERRVLLTGHSAGGAMAMYMLYQRGFPATALATSANYLPPTVTREQVQARADVPLFYAVGKADINHARMRKALVLLRTSGASVTMPTLDIGHVLDQGVLERAADWFGEVCARQVSERLDGAEPMYESGRVAESIRTLEDILAQRAYHRDAVVERCERLHRTLMMPANGQMNAIRALVAADRKVEAVRHLSRLEATYAGCRLADTARTLRLRLEADPDVARHIELQREELQTDEARRMLAEARKLMELRDYDRARAKCRIVSERYADLPEGREAARLLEELLWTGD